MKFYIQQDDERFYYLSQFLKEDFKQTESIEEADIVILGFKENEIPKNIKEEAFLISYKRLRDFNNHALSEQEPFLVKNAYLTALACLKKIDLENKTVVVFGNGRIAKCLKHLSSYPLYILCRHPSEGELPLDFPIYIQADLIINTIPARLKIDEERLKQDVEIYDLSSYPYGFDHQNLKEKGVNIQLLPSLPASEFPYEAGIILYEEVIKCLKSA